MMIKQSSLIFAFLLLIAAEGAILAPKGVSVTVLPNKITDGDTINAVYNGATYRLRLACIDAPETFHSPFGSNSKASLASLVPLNVPVKALVRQLDSYGRSVVELISSTGENININMVKQGQAFIEPRYVAQCGAAPYLAAEKQASENKVGVWSVPGGITRPWICRQTPTVCKTPAPGRKMLETITTAT